MPMKLLLVGDMNSPYLLSYTKWLKRKMDVTVHIFGLAARNISDADCAVYDRYRATEWNSRALRRIKGSHLLIRPFFIRRELQKFIRENGPYDAMDIHCVYGLTAISPGGYGRNAGLIFTTFWGSEWKTEKILGSNALYRHSLRKLLNRTASIRVLTEHMREEILKLAPEVAPKIRQFDLGSENIEYLEKLVGTRTRAESKRLWGFAPDRLTATIGYSGKSLHDHIAVIGTLARCAEAETLRRRLELVLPMTYGCGPGYIREVEDALRGSGFKYRILKDFLDEAAVAELRNSCDIMLQLSRRDAASRSVVEYLIAGSAVISGDWLPYQTFKDAGFRLYEVHSLNEAPRRITEVLDNWDRVVAEGLENRKVGLGRYTWDVCITAWCDDYLEHLNNGVRA